MAFFLATNVLDTTPPVKTPCLVSSKSQMITMPFDATQPHILHGKFRLLSDSKMTNDDLLWGTYASEWGLICNSYDGNALMHREAYNYNTSPIPFDTWFEFTDAKHITEISNVWSRSTTTFTPGSTYPFTIFAAKDSNLSRHWGAFALSAFDVTLDDVKVLDMVPVNERVSVFDLIKDKSYTGGYEAYGYADNVDLRTSTFLRTDLRLSSKYLDADDVWHYAPDEYFTIADETATQYGITINPVFDDGEVGNFLVTHTQMYNMAALPEGAKRFEATLSNVHSTREGCFYDKVNNKYYFSETSTPLVYSEL